MESTSMLNGFCMIFIITVANASPTYEWYSMKEKENPVCNKQECHIMGRMFFESMNQQVNPCDDFYEYACGNWPKKHPRPSNMEMWTAEDVMKISTFERLRVLLESKSVVRGRVEEEQAKAIYKACLSIPFLERSNVNAIKGVIKSINQWPAFPSSGQNDPRLPPWSAIENYYLKVTGESAFYHVKITANTQEDNKIIVRLKEPISVFGMLKRSSKWTTRETRNYKDFLTILIETVASDKNSFKKDAIKDSVQKVLRFRNDLAKIAIYEDDENENSYNPMQIKKLQEIFNRGKTTPKTKAAKDKDWLINWLEDIRVFHKDILDTDLSEETIIDVRHKSYFAQLAHILKDTPRNVIVDHIHLYFLERHLILNAKMEQLLRMSITDSSNPSDKLRYELERWLTCIGDHNMKKTLGEMYVKAYFSKTLHKSVTKLYNEAKELLKLQISGCTWMDMKTKQVSKLKIDKIGATIGALEASKQSWFTKYETQAINPRAIFQTYRNYLFVSAAYLQPPIYISSMPYVVDYGSTISMFGHELQHAFDEHGAKYDSSGNTPWWPSGMIDNLKKKSQCFEQYFGQLKMKELQKYGVSAKKLGRLTLDEDIADAMGLKLAYIGYRKTLYARKGVCPILPGFENFSCEKLFFISYANAFCSAATVDALIQKLLTSTHSIPSIRVNGPISNMKEFRKAFNCEPTHDMYVKTPCELWTPIEH